MKNGPSLPTSQQPANFSYAQRNDYRPTLSPLIAEGPF